MIRILTGDCRDLLATLPTGSVQCVVTSPPYFNLRDYQVNGQIGNEKTIDQYVANLVGALSGLKRVLREDGVFFLNLGDAYLNKSRLLVPARVALALQTDGWLLRDEIVWHKPRATPAPLKDRTVPAHEMLYMFAKQPTYYFDYLAIEEPATYAGVTRKAGKAFRDLESQDPNAARKRPSADREIIVRDTRRKRSVWSVSPSPYSNGHFATFPADLITPCIKAGTKPGDTVLDPFGGAGTTGLVAQRLGRDAVLLELNVTYADMARTRINAEGDLALLTTKLARAEQAVEKLTDALSR